MSVEPTSAELRQAISALGGLYDGPWKAIYDEGAEHGSIRLVEHKSACPGSYVEIAATDQLGDIDNAEPDMGLPNYLAAVSPDVVSALLDALDQAEERLDSMAGQARDVWLLAEKMEKEKKLWVRIASGSEFENQKGRSTLARVQKVLADLELWGHQRVPANQVARDLRAALEGES